MTSGTVSVSQMMAIARLAFEQGDIADAATDARILIGGLLNLSTTELLTRSDRVLEDGEIMLVEAAIQRRLKREPVHRILGRREFFGIDFELSPATLEPRPDTEILVDRILPYLRQIVAKKGSARILDLGTGTGAIGLSLLHECPQAEAVLCDISSDALIVAQRNAERNEVAARVHTVKSDWYQQVSGQFDIIVSNPPYIVRNVISSLAPEVIGFDPILALDGGVDGLDAYRTIAAGAARYLLEGGMVAVEIGYDQRESVCLIFTSCGYVLHEAARDYGGNDRVLVFARDAAV